MGHGGASSPYVTPPAIPRRVWVSNAGMDFRQWLEKVLEDNREALRQFPEPPGLEEFVRDLVRSGQVERVLHLVKFSFLYGIQQGQAQAGLETPPPPKIQA